MYLESAFTWVRGCVGWLAPYLSLVNDYHRIKIHKSQHLRFVLLDLRWDNTQISKQTSFQEKYAPNHTPTKALRASNYEAYKQ
jgi:hypothetical protein